MDSGFHAMDSRYLTLDPADSLSVELGFRILVVIAIRIPRTVFRIPKPRISDSTRKFPGFRIPLAKISRIPSHVPKELLQLSIVKFSSWFDLN